jgi:hypothetical protein
MRRYREVIRSSGIQSRVWIRASWLKGIRRRFSKSSSQYSMLSSRYQDSMDSPCNIIFKDMVKIRYYRQHNMDSFKTNSNSSSNTPSLRGFCSNQVNNNICSREINGSNPLQWPKALLNNSNIHQSNNKFGNPSIKFHPQSSKIKLSKPPDPLMAKPASQLPNLLVIPVPQASLYPLSIIGTV